MYDILIFWLDKPEYIDYLDTEFIIYYNTELLDRKTLEILIDQMIDQGGNINWLKEELIVNYDSLLKVRDECCQYEYHIDNNNLLQLR